jgi:valyl-tRNA synthetase
MVMMGLKVMGAPPFRKVVLHPLVRDASGQKMSKSKGNVIDPLTMIDGFGADPFRFALASQAGSARDLKISKDRVTGCSRFVNKLWNAARFTFSHLEKLKDPGRPFTGAADLPGRWILSRLNACTGAVSEALDGFHFDKAADAVYHFIWDELCDWHLELAKPVLYGKDEDAADSARMALREAFSLTLKLLHPLMPFVTEELWGRIPGARGLIMQSGFPRQSDERNDPEAEGEVGVLMDLTRAVRQARADFGIPPAARVRPLCRTADPKAASLIREYSPLLLRLTGAQEIEVVEDPQRAKPRDAAESILRWGEVWTPVGGEMDLPGERARLEKGLQKLRKDMAQAEAKLRNPGYLMKAPEDVVEETRTRLEGMLTLSASMERSLKMVESMIKDMEGA